MLLVSDTPWNQGARYDNTIHTGEVRSSPAASIANSLRTFVLLTIFMKDASQVCWYPEIDLFMKNKVEVACILLMRPPRDWTLRSILMWGRNASGNKPSRLKPAVYKKATAIECLVRIPGCCYPVALFFVCCSMLVNCGSWHTRISALWIAEHRSAVPFHFQVVNPCNSKADLWHKAMRRTFCSRVTRYWLVWDDCG